MIQYKIKETAVRVVHDNGEIVIANGILIEGDQLCAVYDLDDQAFYYVSGLIEDLYTILACQYLSLEMDSPEEQRLCAECGTPMQEGFYFESDGTQYCSEACLTKVITWEDYLAIHDNGDGDAYWTDWRDC